MRTFYVYILASRKEGTLYTGVTGNLPRRAWEHREGVVRGFTSRYNVKRLVYVEEHATAESAIKREKAIKSWLENRTDREGQSQLVRSLPPIPLVGNGMDARVKPGHDELG